MQSWHEPHCSMMQRSLRSWQHVHAERFRLRSPDA